MTDAATWFYQCTNISLKVMFSAFPDIFISGIAADSPGQRDELKFEYFCLFKFSSSPKNIYTVH